MSRQWVVELEPGSAGSFTIPAIAVGPETTNLLRLTVTESSGDPGAGNRDIFVEVELGLDRAYVQQMIPLTVRLFLGVDILDGSLTCLLYTSPSPRDQRGSRMPSSA